MDTLREFLNPQAIATIHIGGFVANIVLAMALSWVLGQVYIRYGNAANNRTMFASNFVLLAGTTALIITIIKSSLALSLGLVGALSIVRFRAAIKEPEELSFLFLNIAIGLGCGASHGLPTTIGFFLILLMIFIFKAFPFKNREMPNMLLNISTTEENKFSLVDDLVKVIEEHSQSCKVHRIDRSNEIMEASFKVQFENMESMQTCSKKMESLGDMRITIINSGSLI